MLDISGDTSHNPFPTESELYFPVVERENAWLDRNGNPHRIGKQKSLIRMTADHRPQWLANVGENYKVVKNKELFPYMENEMTRVIDQQYLQDVTVNDKMALNGRDCYREYIFNQLKCADFGRGDVAFRIILGNSYGSKAVSMLFGAIDFWCDNGMIIGVKEKQTRKHTSGVTIAGFSGWVADAVNQFAKHGERIERYNDTMIDLTKEDGLFEYLSEKGILSDKMGRKMQVAMHTERNKRGGRDVRPSMWDLYSALTAWATHDDVRDTGNDHEANTRIQRSQHVERVISAADKWMTADA